MDYIKLDMDAKRSLMATPPPGNIASRWDLLPLELKDMIIGYVEEEEIEDDRRYWKVWIRFLNS